MGEKMTEQNLRTVFVRDVFLTVASSLTATADMSLFKPFIGFQGTRFQFS